MARLQTGHFEREQAMPKLTKDELTALHGLERELQAAALLRRLINKCDPSDEEFDTWNTNEGDLLRRIEELPVSPETATIKARAILLVHDGSMEGVFDGDSTDHRLARQVISAIAEAELSRRAVHA